jgi:peptide/nickel transport system substrate-binding protein
MITRRSLGLAAATLAALPRAGQTRTAGTLRIAFDAEWTSLDPHFHSFPYNLSVGYHLFDALTAHDATQQAVPRLAQSWRPLGTEGWEFSLRDDARFQDGSPVSAADVVASIARIRAVRNSPGPLTTVIRPVSEVTAKDARTVTVMTSVPTPALPNLMTSVFILPARLAEATGEDFATGRAQVGSGPFKFVSYARGDRLVLEPNPVHWGAKPAWSRTELRIIPNAGAREAALLAGDVDFIVNPSTTSVARLKADPNFLIHQAVSTRITYLQVHQGETPKADMGGTGGKNPFADARVRRAVSLAIPRQAICERILDGLAVPASQIIGPGQSGHDPSLAVEAPDPDQARRLLAEAGWGQGFEVRLSTPSDRNMNGRRVAEAIAASLTRIGIRVAVNAVPLNVWLAEWRRGEYSMVLHGAGPVPVTWTLVPQLVGTKDMAAGFGPSNESHYSNPALDAVMRQALAEIDTAKREALLHQAARTIRAETALIPLHHEAAVWASRKGLSFAARSDTLTYATEIRPV